VDHRAASIYPSVPFPAGASGSGARLLRRTGNQKVFPTDAPDAMPFGNLFIAGCADHQRGDTAGIAKHAQIAARLVAMARLGLRTRAISASGVWARAFQAWAFAAS
jgi:hypothetical protein